MIYKFNNENSITPYNGGHLVLGGMIYTNPDEQILKAAGYKPLQESEAPEYDEETQILETYYEDGADAILVKYRVAELQIEEAPIEE